MDLDLIFATVVGALAALAVIGALAVLIVAEWYAIRNTIARHRKPSADERFWQSHSILGVPERRQ
jgi:hypothetical protein